MSKIEDYIHKNRKEIDVDNPPEFVWKEIRKNSSKIQKTSSPTLRVWQVAAVFLFILSAGLIFMLNQDKEQPLASLGDMSSEYQLIENEYQKSIDMISAEININEVDRIEYEWLFKELEYLDSLNLQFRNEIGSERDQEKLVEILIDYYEKKLKLLRRLELEINRSKNENETNII